MYKSRSIYYLIFTLSYINIWWWCQPILLIRIAVSKIFIVYEACNRRVIVLELSTAHDMKDNVVF